MSADRGETQVYGVAYADFATLKKRVDALEVAARQDRALLQNALEEVNERLEAIHAQHHADHQDQQRLTSETNDLLRKMLALEVDPGMSVK